MANRMKIATWNVNSLRVRLPQVLEWLEQEQPDVLALQETKLQDPDFPVNEIRDAGYHVSYAGQKTYNGVATLSKESPKDIVTDLPGLEDPQRRVLGATLVDTLGELHVLNLYVPNGATVESDKYTYKLQWLERLHALTEQLVTHHPNLILLGDFNIAPKDEDVHDPERWQGKVLVSEPERDALNALLTQGLVDVFRQFDQAEGLFSWWDYRAGGFRRNHGLRIDLILASQAMADRCTGCHIDKEVRALSRPSDHAPVIAEFRSS